MEYQHSELIEIENRMVVTTWWLVGAGDWGDSQMVHNCVRRWISSGDLMYSIEFIVNSTVIIYSKVATRLDL